MFCKTVNGLIAMLILFATAIAGCKTAQSETMIRPTPSKAETAPSFTPGTNIPPVTQTQLSPKPDLSGYAFPASIDPAKRYLFYLHGKIIEDQGIPAISPDYGEYEYAAILKKLGGYGFVVISEQRPKDTDSVEYAKKITDQVTALLKAGVPAENITIVGASKGAGIVIYASHFLENKEINFVILGICHPDNVEGFKQEEIYLYGNVLSIYDSADELAGSCQGLFSFSEGKGISRHEEIVLKIGTGHGILFKPLDEWVLPVIQWAGR